MNFYCQSGISRNARINSLRQASLAKMLIMFVDRSSTVSCRYDHPLPTYVFCPKYLDCCSSALILLLSQEDDPDTLHLITSFLLFDGRQNEVSLQMMNEEGVFARLLELIQARRREDMDSEAGLHRLLMDLLYEMSRVQRVRIEDLGMFLGRTTCRCQ